MNNEYREEGMKNREIRMKNPLGNYRMKNEYREIEARMKSPLKNELKQRRSESTKVEGRAKNHWLHPISIQSKGSMTKNR